MATFLSDTFTDTNGTALQSHTGEIGATWTNAGEGSGNIEIQTNRCVEASGATGGLVYYSSGTAASADSYVEGVFWLSATGVFHDFAILGRYQTASGNFYLFQHVAFTDELGKWRLYKRVSGSWTELGTYSQTFSATTDYTGKLDMVSTALKCYVDGGSPVIDVTDSAISSAGNAGIRCDAGQNATKLHLASIVGVDTSTGGHPAMRRLGMLVYGAESMVVY